jgi:hypothetical protein
MISANTVTVAEAMLVATPAELLWMGKPARLSGMSPEQIGKMEREMASLQGQYKIVGKHTGKMY